MNLIVWKPLSLRVTPCNYIHFTPFREMDESMNNSLIAVVANETLASLVHNVNGSNNQNYRHKSSSIWPTTVEALFVTSTELPSSTHASASHAASTSWADWLSSGRVQIPLYATILLLAVVGNALVIMTLVQNRRMRTITNVFLLNLAVSDILLGVLCMPITLIGTLLRDFVFGEVMCKLLPYLQGKFVFIFLSMN